MKSARSHVLLCGAADRGFVFIPHIMRPAVSLLLAALLLSACGYKGPLYLPKPEAQRPAPAPAPDAAKEAAPAK